MSVEMQQPSIAELLKWVGSGHVQLPDFQREYRWDVERIRELLVSVLRGHPMGVIMMLQTGNAQIPFKPKVLTGVVSGGENCKDCALRFAPLPKPHIGEPGYLLLDGQQRLTSLYQALSGDGVVHTADERGKLMHVRFFLDIEKCLGNAADQDDAVMALPADGIERTNFARDILRDCSTMTGQVQNGLMPITAVFADAEGSATNWMLEYLKAGGEDSTRRTALFADLQNRIFTPMKAYQIPGIELPKDTSREAVATVFEKVNTGGLALDTFELLTATFAGDPLGKSADGQDFRLVDDWKRTQAIIARYPSLAGFQRILFLQAVTLLVTRARRIDDIRRIAEDPDERAKPRPTSARREDILRIELPEYLAWAGKVREALPWVAQFLTARHIHDERFVPYPTQAVPLAVLRVILGADADKFGVAQRLHQWYWSGVFGELYGSTTETKFARDIDQVPAWALAGVTGESIALPDTVQTASFSESRLLTMRTRLSAAYKGLYALLMERGCKDWQFDQVISHANYTEMQVDIHHIFPKKWCDDHGVDESRRESIINKTPIARATNIMIGGNSPATYLKTLEAKAGLQETALDALVETHLIDSAALRAADFDAFFEARREALVVAIEAAMGKPVLRDLATADTSAFVVEPEDVDEVEVGIDV